MWVFQNPEIIFYYWFPASILRQVLPLVNLPIFNSLNKNKAGDINSLWSLLVFSFSNRKKQTQ